MGDLMRAVHRLDNLADDAFFAEVPQGMRLIAENVASYDADRRLAPRVQEVVLTGIRDALRVDGGVCLEVDARR